MLLLLLLLLLLRWLLLLLGRRLGRHLLERVLLIGGGGGTLRRRGGRAMLPISGVRLLVLLPDGGPGVQEGFGIVGRLGRRQLRREDDDGGLLLRWVWRLRLLGTTRRRGRTSGDVRR